MPDDVVHEGDTEGAHYCPSMHSVCDSVCPCGGVEVDDEQYSESGAEVERDNNLKNSVGRTKAQLGLLPPVATIVGSMAMEDGAEKYGPYNWRQEDSSVEYMQYLNAILRHVYALMDGEDHADDSKVHHLGHVIATAGILLDAQGCGTLVDDRPPAGPAADALQEARTRRA